jgi:hypothetical protein
LDISSFGLKEVIKVETQFIFSAGTTTANHDLEITLMNETDGSELRIWEISSSNSGQP